MIPEEAIERVAYLISERDYPYYEPDNDFAREVLESAAPLIAAQALRDAVEALHADDAPHRRLMNTIYAAWLTERIGALATKEAPHG